MILGPSLAAHGFASDILSLSIDVGAVALGPEEEEEGNGENAGEKVVVVIQTIVIQAEGRMIVEPMAWVCKKGIQVIE